MKTKNETPAANTVATLAEIAARPLAGFDSKSPLYTALWDAMGGFRAETLDPVSILAAAYTAIATNKALDAAAKESAADMLAQLPVAIAGIGAATVAQVMDGDVTLPESGDRGYMLSLIGVRAIKTGETDDEGKPVTRNGMIGLAIYPAHSVESFGATEDGKGWLTSLVEKECGLVAFRRLRFTPGESTISELTEAALGMPVGLADYASRARANAAEAFAVFHDNYATFRALLAKNPGTAGLVSILPAKRADVLAAIRSKEFAETIYPDLERANVFVNAGKIFAFVVKDLANQATEQGIEFDYDTDAPTRWLEGRDELKLLKRQVVSDDAIAKLDFSAFGI